MTEIIRSPQLAKGTCDMNNLRITFGSKCAGKGCKRKGVNILKIRFLHKKGIFCKECSNELVHLDLVEDILDTKVSLRKMDDESVVDKNSRHPIMYSHPLGGKQND